MAHGDNTRLYNGEGKMYLGDRVGGEADGLQFVGNVTELMLEPKVERKEHREKQSGNNSVDKVIEKNLDVDITMTLDSLAVDNLKRMIFGVSVDFASTTVTAETHVARVGKSVSLSNMNVTAIALVTDLGGALPMFWVRITKLRTCLTV